MRTKYAERLVYRTLLLLSCLPLSFLSVKICSGVCSDKAWAFAVVIMLTLRKKVSVFI